MRWQRLLVQALAHVDGPVLLLVLAAGLARSLWLTVLLTAIAGAADLISAAYRRTILQTYAPDAIQGRLQGFSWPSSRAGPAWAIYGPVRPPRCWGPRSAGPAAVWRRRWSRSHWP